LELSKHSAVISSIHQHFVKTGKLDKDQGKILNWLFELRGVADYGGMEHVSAEEVKRAIGISEKYIRTIKCLLKPKDDHG
jgi:uncharacterized protein (UPF0332 family)